MRTTNWVSSGYTPIQVGRIVPADESASPSTPEPAPEQPTEQPEAAVAVTNVRSGNARVGIQADVIVGDVYIR